MGLIMEIEINWWKIKFEFDWKSQEIDTEIGLKLIKKNILKLIDGEIELEIEWCRNWIRN